MGHSLACEYSHIVFSTKMRHPWLKELCRQKCYNYMAGVAAGIQAKIIEIGGIDDHVHILVRRPAPMSSSVFAKRVKGASSVWFKKEYPDSLGFSWQDGFSSFSVSPSVLPKVRRYIQRQQEHHKTKDYLTELKELLDLHGVEYKERDILD